MVVLAIFMIFFGLIGITFVWGKPKKNKADTFFEAVEGEKVTGFACLKEGDSFRFILQHRKRA